MSEENAAPPGNAGPPDPESGAPGDPSTPPSGDVDTGGVDTGGVDTGGVDTGGVDEDATTVATTGNEDQAGPRRKKRVRLVRLLGLTLVLAVMGYLGGVAATALRPVTVETEHYRASVSIAPGFGEFSGVRAPTVFGDITLEFAGPVPAPGIEARVQVREEITQLFTTGFELDVDSFTPDAEEIREALTDGLRDLSITFLAGVLITETLITSVWLLGRGRWPNRRVMTAFGTAAVTAMVVPAGTSTLVYQQDNFSAFEVTSLLGTVHDNVNMLDDIQGASEQATPYIYNLLALSDALQNEFVPAEARSEPAARILLVSDVHGMNYYSLMREIVISEEIDAVIDTGDLVNWGTVEEGEMAGIFASIESLGVPYIFARGNHDATGPNDEAVLRRMEQIPNVILVEPTDGEFVEAQVNGVRIAGFNDPRYWGDSNEAEEGAELQTEAAHRFRDAVEDWGAPDVLITHQPYAAHRAPSNGIRVAGHMHVPDLDGSLIQVGTFTGGGLFNHFQMREMPDEDEEYPAEAANAPYAFDIANFGEDCSLQSVNRYTYRNLVLGRPQYDGVSVVNGARIADPPEDRTCGADLGVEAVPIVPATPEEGADTDEGDALADVDAADHSTASHHGHHRASGFEVTGALPFQTGPVSRAAGSRRGARTAGQTTRPGPRRGVTAPE